MFLDFAADFPPPCGEWRDESLVESGEWRNEQANLDFWVAGAAGYVVALTFSPPVGPMRRSDRRHAARRADAGHRSPTAVPCPSTAFPWPSTAFGQGKAVEGTPYC